MRNVKDGDSRVLYRGDSSHLENKQNRKRGGDPKEYIRWIPQNEATVANNAKKRRSLEKATHYSWLPGHFGPLGAFLNDG
jgi:hypothetical protein